MTHFEKLKERAGQLEKEVGTISGEGAIILDRYPDGRARWYLYDCQGQVQCIGPEEEDDKKVGPLLAGKTLDEIIEIIHGHARPR